MNDPQPEGHMASYIGRRKFLATLGGAAVVWPLAAHAQQPGPVRRIVVLMGAAETASSRGWLAAFLHRLDELGWRESRNLVTQVQWGPISRSRCEFGPPNSSRVRPMSQ